MSITPSQPALEALSRTEFVVMSTRTQKTTVSGELTQKFAPILTLGEGTPMPDWDALQDSHAALLELSAAEVRRVDHQHRAKKTVMSGYRKQRQALAGDLKVQYRDLRKSVDAAYGEAGLVAFGIESPPPRRFVAVHEQMRELLEQVRDPDFPARLPEPKAGQTVPDLQRFATSLDARIQELEALMETIRRMQKLLDESYLVKRETLRQSRRTYLNLARIQEGYYRLVGLDDLADRIRTEVHRTSPRRKPAQAGTPAEESSPEDSPAEGTPPAGPPADAPPVASPDSSPTLDAAAPKA
jgi:hypothetical protein